MAVVALPGACAVLAVTMLGLSGRLSREPVQPPPAAGALSAPEAVLREILPARGGPVRSLPWAALRPGEWDSRTYTISTAAPPLRDVMAAVAESLVTHDAADRRAGGGGLPRARAKLVIIDWQPNLRRVSLRLLWQPDGEPERTLAAVGYVHARGRARPWSGRAARAVEEGAGLYAAACAGCHGVAGRGVPAVAPPLESAQELARRMGELGVSGRPADFVAAAVAAGRPVGNTGYGHEMPAWSRAAGGSLSPERLAAVVAFVRNWHAPAPAPHPPPEPPPNGAPAALGAALYGAGDCLGCHGWPGHGGITGPDLAGAAARGAERLPGVDGEGALRVDVLAPSAILSPDCPTGPCADMMPRDYGTSLSQRELELLVRYMLTLDGVEPVPARPGAPPPLQGALAPAAGPETASAPERGALLYADHCAVCHGALGRGGMGGSFDAALASVEPHAYVRAATAQGVPGMMPPWDRAAGGPLSERDLDAVAAYAVELARRWAQSTQ